MIYIVGLGNPGSEYENSRHNAGRMTVLKLAKNFDGQDFTFSKKSNALTSEIKINKEKVVLILPETFMNKSGQAVGYFIKPKTGKDRSQKKLVVIHDDLDLPIGSFKISYNKGMGGHRGLESVLKTIKTQEFVRIRIGIAPTTPSGKLKKPDGEKKVLDFILGNWKPAEVETLKKVFKKINEVIEILVTDGHERAMNLFN